MEREAEEEIKRVAHLLLETLLINKTQASTAVQGLGSVILAILSEHNVSTALGDEMLDSLKESFHQIKKEEKEDES